MRTRTRTRAAPNGRASASIATIALFASASAWTPSPRLLARVRDHMPKRRLAEDGPAANSQQRCWLVKSEPDDYSIQMMEEEGTTVWDGVRNAVARRNLRSMSVGDAVLFYHSSCNDVGVVGLVEVASAAYPDPADEKWAVVDVRFRGAWPLVPLAELKRHADGALEGLALFRQPRLSVQPVSAEHLEFIRALSGAGGE